MPLDPSLLSAATGAALNPAAYGSIPIYPASTTDTTTGTSSWAPNLPFYPGLSEQASQLAQSEMAGQLPPDVIDLLQQQGAERGIRTGSPGSPNANAAYLRALGLNSLALQQQGLTNYQGLLAGAPRTTTTTGAVTTSNANLIAEANAAPNPYLAALANLAGAGAGMEAGGAGARRTGNFPITPPITGGGGAPLPPVTGGGNQGGAGGGYPSPVVGAPQNRVTAPPPTSALGNLYSPQTIGGSSIFGTAGGYDMFNPGGFNLPNYGEMPDYSGAGVNYPVGAPTIENAQQMYGWTDPGYGYEELFNNQGQGGEDYGWTDPGYGYEDLLNEPGTGEEWWYW